MDLMNMLTCMIFHLYCTLCACARVGVYVQLSTWSFLKNSLILSEIRTLISKLVTEIATPNIRLM